MNVSSFFNQGYAPTDSIVTADTATHIRTFLLEAITQRGVPLTQIRKNQWHFVFPQLRPLFTSPVVTETAKNLLKSDTLFLWAMTLFVKFPRNGDTIYAHQDGTGWGIGRDTALSFWVPLQDCSADLRNGPFQVFDRPLDNNYFDVKTDGRNDPVIGQHAVVDNLGEPISLEIKAGKGIVFPPNLLHSSAANYTEWPRVAVALRIISSKCVHYCPESRPMTVVRLCGSDETDMFRVVELEELPDKEPAIAKAVWASQLQYGSELIRFRDSAVRHWRE